MLNVHPTMKEFFWAILLFQFLFGEALRFQKGVPYNPEDNSEDIELTGVEGTIYSKTLTGDVVETISLFSSNIEAIEDGALCPPHVERIAFEECSLPQLKGSIFGNCPTLRELNLDSNSIQGIDEDFLSGLWNLEELQIILNDSAVAYLNVTSRNFFSNTKKLRSLIIGRKVELHSKTFTRIPAGLFDSVRELKTLEIYCTDLNVIEEGFLAKLSTLVSLDLSINELDEFPWEGLRHLPNLEELSLNGNNLKSIDVDKIIKYLPKLSKVDLQNNDVSCSKMEDIVQKLRKEIPGVQTDYERQKKFC